MCWPACSLHVSGLRAYVITVQLLFAVYVCIYIISVMSEVVIEIDRNVYTSNST